MNEESKDVYLIKQRSGRNLAVVGGLIPVALVIGLLILVARAPWLSWWSRFSSIVAICIFSLIGVLSLFQLIRNPVIELKISKNGIQYGPRFLQWSEINRLYPRGGLTILGGRRYQLGYSLNKKIQITNDLPVDGGISKEEFTKVIERIDEEVSPRFPHLKLKKP